MVSYYPFLKNTSECQAIANASGADFSLQATLDFWQVALLFSGIGVLSATLAKGFNIIRKLVYKDKDNVDNSFDAGGKISLGLTATTIVSQWTWAASLLQSTSVASKYGIVGAFWYASGATIQVLLFSMIGVQLKIRAPGAKTFLQVIRARFGKRTHIVYCVFALITNIIVTAMLMLGGAAVLTTMVHGLSVELAVAMVVAIIGTYTYIGGMGAIFYVSYFNSAIILIIILIFMGKVFYDNDVNNPLGSMRRAFELVSCSQGPDGNEAESFLTVNSNEGLMFGIINIVGNFGTVFVDQSYWQCNVAAKPKQSVWGFLLGGLTWFAVPFTFATTMGLGYISLSALQGQAILSEDEVNAGLVAPAVAKNLMGFSGEVLMVAMLLMAVTSTASAEVMAVTSILVYDVYQLYLKPYRLVLDSNSCILCGRGRGRHANPRDKCLCISMTYCPSCTKDDERRLESKRAILPPYTCTTHGPYRVYNEYLAGLKNWCLLWVTLAIIPLTLILYAVNVSLNWVYLFMGVSIGSAVIPVALCMFWTRLTGVGMIAGGLGGAAVGLTSWLAVAATLDGGLGDFINNTGNELSMLCGNVCAIACGGLFCIVVSLATNRNYDPSTSEAIWESTRDIDNPLCPWTERYARDLKLDSANQLDNRPPLEEVADVFRWLRRISYVGAPVLTVILILLWPGFSSLAGVFTYRQFQTWVTVSHAWGILATVFIIVMPFISEGLELRASLDHIKQVAPMAAPPVSPLLDIKSHAANKPSEAFESAPPEQHTTAAENDTFAASSTEGQIHTDTAPPCNQEIVLEE